jgi:hypothetical protein
MSIMELLRKLNQLERCALEGVTTNILRTRIDRVLRDYTLATGNPNLSPMYRARRNNSSELFNHVFELWHPPQSLVSAGRLNTANSPLLYASSADMVAMAELKPTVGDVITVLQIESRSDSERPNCVTIGELSHVNRTKRSLYPRGSHFLPAAFIETIGGENYKRSISIDRTIGNWFATDGDTHYSLTSAVADFLFGIPGLDGIVYPAIGWGEGLNVALRPEAADRLFVPMKAHAIKITDPEARYGQCGGTYLAVSKGIDPDGAIRWERR